MRFRPYIWFWIVNGFAFLSIGVFISMLEALYGLANFDNPASFTDVIQITIFFVNVPLVLKSLLIFMVLLLLMNFGINFFVENKITNFKIILLSCVVPVFSYLITMPIMQLLARM
jgi:hypothetical protein